MLMMYILRKKRGFMLDFVDPVYSKASKTFVTGQQSKKRATSRAIKNRLVVSIT